MVEEMVKKWNCACKAGMFFFVTMVIYCAVIGVVANFIIVQNYFSGGNLTIAKDYIFVGNTEKRMEKAGF